MFRESLNLILGIIFLLLGLMLIVLLSNKICKIIDNNRIPRIFILIIHLILIASMIIILRQALNKYITNANIMNGIK